MASAKQFVCGSEVMARWDGLYYPATVLEVKSKSISVRFDDGLEMDVDIKHVNRKERFRRQSSRSPGRKSSRSRSPARRRKLDQSGGDGDCIQKPLIKGSSNKVEENVDKHKVGIVDNIVVLFVYATLMGLPLLLLRLCDGNICQLESDPMQMMTNFPRDISGYFNWISAVVISGYVLFMAALYSMPMGSIVSGPTLPWGKKLKYRLNGPYALMFILIAFGLLVWFQFRMEYIYNNLLQLTVIYTILMFILHVSVYFLSFKSPPDQLFMDGNTGWFLVDCFVGRDIAPRIGKYFDVKLFSYYIGVTGVLVINLVYLQTELERTGTIRKELMLACGMHIGYTIVMFYLSEEKAFYSFDIKHEGCGFGFIYGATVFYPIVYTMQPRHILQHPNLLPTPTLWICCAIIVFICGLGLTFYSDMEKFRFRKNPLSSNHKSIAPTKKGGHHLLISGPWGFVRHPNYLGEILTFIALSLTCGFTYFYIWLCPVFVIGFLPHRATRDEKVCLAKHGQAWQEYCNRVPYRVIPFIF